MTLINQYWGFQYSYQTGLTAMDAVKLYNLALGRKVGIGERPTRGMRLKKETSTDS